MGSRFDWVADIDYNDIAVLLGYVAGHGRATWPAWASSTTRSRASSDAPAATWPRSEPGWARYLRASTDHKVIGIQYLIGIGDVLLHRRRERHADPHRAPAPELAHVLARPVPDDRRPARRDDDHDGLEHHPGAVRALLRADHDRQPADGLPAARGALVLAAAAGRRDPREHDRLRRLPHRLDRLPDAREPGRRRHGRLPVRVRAGRRRHDPERAEHARHGVQPPRARHDLVAAADLRLEHADDVGADAARAADAARRGVHAGARPHVGDDLLLGADRREPLPVGEPVLVLRPPRGLHPRPAGLRDRARDPAGLRPQAALGLPAGRVGHARRHAALVHGVAAPPVRERHQLQPAPVLHADDGADLGADRLHLPRRDRDALAGPDPLHGADAVRARVLRQLPHRRALRRVPVRRPERRHACTAASS